MANIKGNSRANKLKGTSGDDTIYGKGGNDKLYGGKGDDKLYGGKGNDKLFGGKGDDKLFGGKGNDKIYGGRGDDYVKGGSGNDKIHGGHGNDYLNGGSGKDKIYGGHGDDTLVGGKGADKLKGGSGMDTFVYLHASDSPAACGWDRILDFKQGEDRIDFSAFGDLAWNAGNGPMASGVWYDLAGHGKTFVYADTDGNGVADLKIELKGDFTPVMTDFVGVTYADPVPPVVVPPAPVDDGAPSILLEKSVSSSSVAEGGVGNQTVTYTYTLTNTSAAITDPLTLLSLLDDQAGDILAGGTLFDNGDGDALLAPGESWVYTIEQTVVAGNVGNEYVNSAEVRAQDDEGDEASSAASATVTFTNLDPTIAVVKTVDANGDGDLATGDGFAAAEGVPAGAGNPPVTYRYTLTNESAASTDPLTIVSLMDDNGTPGDASDDFTPDAVLVGAFNVGDTNMDGLLDRGETWVFSSISTVPVGNAGDAFVNEVTVTASDDEGTPTVAKASATVNYLNPPPVANSDQWFITNNTVAFMPAVAALANDTGGGPLTVTRLSSDGVNFVEDGDDGLTDGFITAFTAAGRQLFYDIAEGTFIVIVTTDVLDSFYYELSDGASTAAGKVEMNLVNSSTFGNDTIDISAVPGAGAGSWSYLEGKDGVDTIIGGAGNDVIDGSAGADTLTGGAGDDLLMGGLGNDFYRFGLADGTNDQIEDNGNGTDRIHIDANGAVLSELNFERVGNDLVMKYHGQQVTVVNQYTDASDQIDRLEFVGAPPSFKSYQFGSVLRVLDLDFAGGNGGDVMAGTSGGESMSGLAGNDLLFGNGGDDILNGGAGTDLLVGGEGSDIFDFNATTDSSATLAPSDVIADFEHGIDKIDLSDIAVPGTADGAFVFGGNNAGTIFNGVTWSEDAVNGYTIVRADSNGDAIADMQIIVHGLNLGLDSTDFIL